MHAVAIGYIFVPKTNSALKRQDMIMRFVSNIETVIMPHIRGYSFHNFSMPCPELMPFSAIVIVIPACILDIVDKFIDIDIAYCSTIQKKRDMKIPKERHHKYILCGNHEAFSSLVCLSVCLSAARVSHVVL